VNEKIHENIPLGLRVVRLKFERGTCDLWSGSITHLIVMPLTSYLSP